MRVFVRAEGKDGKVTEEYWKDGIGGILDNEYGPAFVLKSPRGVTLEEQYYRDGRLHRWSGPAKISRRSDGSISQEQWYRDGHLHRDDGAAEIVYNLSGKSSETFWRDGVCVPDAKADRSI